ncbi:MAG: HEAT repeat domain-containing protein, partial [Planctomycetota bacterium]
MWRVLVVLGLTVLVPGSPRDLDVAVPPGTPLEWTGQLRQPVPTGHRGAVPTKPVAPKKEEGKEGAKDRHQTVAEEREYYVPDHPYAVGRITTIDLPMHLPKLRPPKGKASDEVPTGGQNVVWEYPPVMSSSLYWYTVAVYLRQMLHPALVSEKELVQFLVELGEPAAMVADAVRSEKACAKMASAVKSSVRQMPGNRPMVPRGKTEWEAMVYRLAAEDLTGDYVYSLNPYFAQRLLALGEDGFFAVASYAESRHSFIQHNAVAVLGNYRHPEALPLLRKLFRESRDKVTRNRALSHLIRNRDVTIVDAIIEKLKDRDFAAYGIYALGALGHKKATKTVLRFAEKAEKRKEPDGLWAAIPALARLKDPEALGFLKGLEERLRSPKAGLYDPPPQDPKKMPDKPDKPGTKARILWEMTILALARLGQKEAQEKVFEVIAAAKAEEPPPPPQPWGRDFGTPKNALRGFHVPVYFLLLETLFELGEKGREQLAETVRDHHEDTGVRIQALKHHSVPVPDKEMLAEIAASKTVPASLSAAALRLLYGPDAEKTKEIAKELLERYVAEPEKQPPRLPPAPKDGEPQERNNPAAESFLVVAAMKLLGKTNENDPDLLLKIIEKEIP